MRKHLILTICLSLSTMLSAAAMTDNPSTATININGNGATLGSLPLSALSEITFSNDNLVITNGSESQSFPLTDISELTFELSTSSVDDVSADLTNDLNVTLQNGILTATSAAGNSIEMVIYSINGQSVDRQTAMGQLTFNLNNLTKGIYIIKVNEKAIKFTR